ncbi:MAG: hypothetical protein OEU36_13770 [Gammaproteobacteria bacterium]|nr:hypothetical protein [Gammaproteobacteria bacterium]
MPFDENIGTDIAQVLDASALLDITEYHFFQLAYLRWHGSFADEQVMEPIYAAYMFRELVPSWVRHFARLVCRLDRMEKLDKNALGVPQLPSTRQMVRRGTRYTVIVASAITALIVIAEFTAQTLQVAERCMFPPCY